MKIKTIHIENFRSIKRETVECTPYNMFVGPNGSGKSTVLNALNVFFGEISKFSESDFYERDTDKNIEINVVFEGFSDPAREEFEHYIRDDKLVVNVEIFKDEEGKFVKKVRGERIAIPEFAPFFELPKTPASARKEAFDELRKRFPEIATATSDAAREKALLDYEEEQPVSEKKLIKSGASFFGVSKGVDRFKRHIHWVYVPAVKDASTESEEAKTSHLGKLIQHTIRSGMDYDSTLEEIKSDALAAYTKLLDGQKDHLSKLEKRLSARLQGGVTTDANLELDWKKDDKSVSVLEPVAQVLLKEREFSGEVESFGHGLQRSFLIVILQELMAVDSEVSPTLLLGCEEPELYQHPPQAKHLSSILAELAEGDAQVFCTTHSPYFINVDYYDGIKKFRNVDGETKISFSRLESIIEGYNGAFEKELRNEDQARAKLSIQIQPKYNEMFFSDKIVLVEGISDQACLETYLRLSGKHSDFRRSGISTIVCDGKSSLVLLLLMAKDFGIPSHVIFDCDSGAREQDLPKHEKDNCAILSLTDTSLTEAFPEDHIIESSVTAWTHDIEALLEEQFEGDVEVFATKGREAVGCLANAKKNPVYVVAAVSEAWKAGRRFPILERVADNILNQEN